MKKQRKLIGAGLMTAIASSLCCITPLLAFISGSTGMASSFSWMEPYRPYLIIFSILVLGFAWYQKLKPKKEIDCNCDTNEKESFFQSKKFLAIVTVFSILMTLFPYYSSAFYAKEESRTVIVDKENIQTVDFVIEGMTCASCEQHVDHAIFELPGIVETHTSYELGHTQVQFDKTKTNFATIKKAIATTGYSVVNQK